MGAGLQSWGKGSRCPMRLTLRDSLGRRRGDAGPRERALPGSRREAVRSLPLDSAGKDTEADGHVCAGPGRKGVVVVQNEFAILLEVFLGSENFFFWLNVYYFPQRVRILPFLP